MRLKDWVPIRLAWQAREPVGEFMVEWCWLGRERFLAPFFDQTIEDVQSKPFNSLFIHRTPMAELMAWREASPGIYPTGFIFHMSRCGSTLVSQMLAGLAENVVISEAGPIDNLARAVNIAEDLRIEWLRAMVSALGQKRAGVESRCFVKFDSVTIDALPLIRRAFPAVPWIFLYREPEEVLLSQLRETAAAMSPGFIRGPAVIAEPVADLMCMPAEEYGARVIGELCRHAALALDDRGLLVNYTQLPEAVWKDIAPHFVIQFAPAEIEAMKEIARFNAKRPRRTFEADGESKRREISRSAREAAARWIRPHYEKLEAQRLRVSP